MLVEQQDGDAQWGLGGHHGGWQGGAWHGMLKLVFVIMVATIYVCCWAIGEVKSVIEMVLDEKDDRVVHKVEMVITKEWRKVSYL